MGHELEDYCKELSEGQDYETISGEKLTTSEGTLSTSWMPIHSRSGGRLTGRTATRNLASP